MPDFNFQELAIALAAVSFGGIGVILAGAFIFPSWAERAMKQQLPLVLIGIVLVGVSGLIISSLGGGGGTPLTGPALNWSVPPVPSGIPAAFPSYASIPIPLAA